MARICLPSGEWFQAEPGENLLSAAQRAHWLVRYGCRNGNCKACAATLLAGRVQQNDTTVDAATAGPSGILLCRCRTEQDLTIRLPDDPQHGSRDQARRVFVRVQSVTPEEGAWRLRLQLPAGRRRPCYPGQYLLIDSSGEGDNLQRAEIDTAASAERSLSVLTTALPELPAGDHCHILYPLGFGYLAAPPAAPVLIVSCRQRRLQATLWRAELPRAVVMEAMGEPWLPPPLNGQPLVLACADSETQARQWFAALLEAGLHPREFRCDFGIWWPWRVMRQDDNDNRFEIAASLTEEAARARATKLTEGGHRQLYWAEPQTPDHH